LLEAVSEITDTAVRVTVADDLTRLSVFVCPAQYQEDQEINPLAEIFLSPEEKAILRAIGTETVSAKTVAVRLGQTHGTGEAPVQLRAIMNNLEARGILERPDGEWSGYRINPIAMPVLRRHFYDIFSSLDS
jgi:hypothetical protein